jgi:hypothetical protein
MPNSAAKNAPDNDAIYTLAPTCAAGLSIVSCAVVHLQSSQTQSQGQVFPARKSDVLTTRPCPGQP